MGEVLTRQLATREVRGKPHYPTSRYSDKPHVNKLPGIEGRRSFESGSSNMQPIVCYGSGGGGCEASAGLGPNRDGAAPLPTDGIPHTVGRIGCRRRMRMILGWPWVIGNSFPAGNWGADGHRRALAASSRAVATLPPSPDCQWKS